MGLECKYNYRWFGGCGDSDPLRCAPKDTYTCDRDMIWRRETLFDLPCENGNALVLSPSERRCKPGDCPLSEPTSGDTCFEQQVGKTCYYDYFLTGCTIEDALCTPRRSYTCGHFRRWAGITIDPPVCDDDQAITTTTPPIGDPCNPGDNDDDDDDFNDEPGTCPPTQPADGSSCNENQAGLDCPYSFIYFGCNYQDGYTCVPADSFYCDPIDLTWNFLQMIPRDCIDPVQGSALGIPCEPCPDVEPEGLCPPQMPNPGEACSVDESILCKYDFGFTGCSANELQCTPKSAISCTNGQWGIPIAFPSPPPCPPTGKECPRVPPRDPILCRSYGYDPGLTCQYNFVDVSCDQSAEECIPTTTMLCTESDGWEVTTVRPEWDLPCEDGDYPSDWLHSCVPDPDFKDCDETPCRAKQGNPCPVAKPVPERPCLINGHDVGLQCSYDYRDVSCYDDVVKCVATQLYQCTMFGWQEAVGDHNCDSGYPDKWNRRCRCPDPKPEFGEDCQNVGLSCYYEYRNLSCDKNTELCSPTEFYTCWESQWSVVTPNILCPDGDYPPTFGDVCNPI